MAESLLLTAVAILAVGIAGQALSGRFRVPSVVFYLVGGLLLGEVGIGLVSLETFGDGLTTVVGISVAVIVFDGAFALRLERIREAETASLRLVTVGAAMTLVGTAVAVRVLTGAAWDLSFLVGALLIATGPTVITPIVNVVYLREHVSAALETEGIVNDVTAAILAVVIFEEVLLLEEFGPNTVVAFAERLGVGIAAGVAAAGIASYLLHDDRLPGGTPRSARFVVLLAAVGSYGVADTVSAEAGVAAAATAGLVLSNLDIPHRETITEFTGDVTLLLLGFVFVSLAALVDVDAVLNLGLAGVALVAVVMLVIRPLVALVSTAGIEQFTRSERLFLSAVGPRGIIPASVATLFAIELAAAGDTAGAGTLLGAVFVVIFATDAIEAGFARQIGDALGVTPMRTIIVGGGRVGRSLAEQLENRDEFVVIVDVDDEQCERAREAGFRVVAGDGTETEALRRAGIDDAKAVVAATSDDDINLLVCQTVMTKFDVDDVYARVNVPENVDKFEALGVDAVDDSRAAAYALDNQIERPSLSRWMTDLGDNHDILEVRVTARHVAGKSIRELNDEIPGGCLIAEIGRGDDAHVPEADEVIEYGDRVTFLGDSDAVEEAVDRFHPHD
ncbi:NAD-binding protein [Halobaculum sp. CBA1158]|uniref:NAD-binding protein n=1 Tax=Halobaculum sp. CBA1158 TaxID=2904243 RepID=UPI001F2BA9D2|nr:NAD-binding protein [Halobaculum sp. CBA1158]UIO98752.1 NAD-binding protein [Halobaculum sp. CBA1158]